MFRESGAVRPHAGVALRFLIRSHTLLSYVSALGAHRTSLAEARSASALFDSIEGAAAALDALAQDFVRGTPDAAGASAGSTVREALASAGQAEADSHEAASLVRTQLGPDRLAARHAGHAQCRMAAGRHAGSGWRAPGRAGRRRHALSQTVRACLVEVWRGRQ